MLRVALGRRDGNTVLRDLHQEGSLKARFPRPAARLELALLNTAGGIAGGDRLCVDLTLDDGGEATVASQAAERCYRSLAGDPPALVRHRVRLGSGAALEWLPQETILFDGCTLERQLQVEMAGSACFLGIESLVFGRAAMGEQVRAARLLDRIRIVRDGTLLLHDAIRVCGDVAGILGRAAVAGPDRAVATLVLVVREAGERLDAVRAVLAECDADAAASAWDGMLVARILARDGARLRAAVVAAAEPLRQGRPWPRVWQC